MKAATIIKDGLELGIFETYYSEQATHKISLSLRVNDPINVFFGFLFFFSQKHYCYSLWENISYLFTKVRYYCLIKL